VKPRPKIPNARAGTPRAGAILKTLTPTLRWKKATGKVTLYNLQFFSIADNGTVRKVLSAFPTGVSYKVPPRRLKAGVRYMWRLWPYHGSKATQRPFIVSYFDMSLKAVAPKAAARKPANRTPAGP